MFLQKNYHHHGDVLLFPVKEVQGKLVKKNAALVLAEGEVTGHCHTLEKTKAKLYMKDGEMYLKVNEPAKLKHQEHNTQIILPNNYRVGRVREYDPWDKAIRDVQD